MKPASDRNSAVTAQSAIGCTCCIGVVFDPLGLSLAPVCQHQAAAFRLKKLVAHETLRCALNANLVGLVAFHRPMQDGCQGCIGLPLILRDSSQQGIVIYPRAGLSMA